MNDNTNEQPVSQTGFMEQIEQEANESLHPLLQKIVDNIRLIGLTLLVIIGSVGGYAWYQNNQESKMATAREKLGTIAMEKDAGKKIEALNAFLGKAPAQMKTAIRLELIQTYQLQQDYKSSLQQWDKLAASTDKTIKTLALLGQANDNVQLKQFDKALSQLKQAKDVAGEAYTTIISSQIGNVAEQAGKWQDALGAYEDLKNDIRITNKDFINYKINQLKQQIAKG